MPPTSGIGHLTTDRELRVRSWNAWLAEATGIDDADALGRPLLDLIPDERRELYAGVLGDVIESGSPRVLAPAFHHYLFACRPAVPSSHFDRMQQRVTVAPLLVESVVAGVLMTIEDLTAVLDDERRLAARLQRAPSSGQALAALGADDWRVRRAAVQALQQAVTPDDIASLLNSVEHQHQDLAVLNSALRVLIAANRDVVAPLSVLIRDPHPNLRMHAALALGELGDPAAAPALVAALDDADANVRFHAIEALGRLGVGDAVEPLTRIADSGDFFLAFPAIDALARTDDPRVASKLLSLLHHELLRPAIVDTLAAVADEECVAPLVALLDDDTTPAGPIAAALVRLQDRYEDTFAAGEQITDIARQAVSPSALGRLVGAVQRRESPLPSLVTVLGWLGTSTAATDALIGALHDAEVQGLAAAALEGMGSAAVPGLIQALGHDDDRHGRVAIAALLGRLGDRRAVPPLSAQLRSADAELVTAATAALATIGDTRPLEDLLELFGHEHHGVRQAAIAAVNAIGSAVTEARVRALLADTRPRVREGALRVAGYFGFATTAPAVIAALGDDDGDVRRAAIEQLPLLEHPRAALLLADAMQREDTPRNRAAAAHAARWAEPAAVDAALVAALADPDPWVRYFAAGSAGERRVGSAAQPLAAMAWDDPAPQVRIAAIQALGAIDPAATLPLAVTLIDGDDDDAAAAAVAAIAAVSEPRVDELLARAAASASPAIRRAAVAALARRTRPAAIDTLTFAAQITDPPDVAPAALDALAAVAARGDRAIVEAAVRALLSLGLEPARRGEVVAALGRVPVAAAPAIAAGLTDERVAVRLTAVDALARLRHPAASQALAAALADADPAVRAAAVAGFGRLGTAAVADTIVALRERDADQTVRRRAALVCERYGWGA